LVNSAVLEANKELPNSGTARVRLGTLPALLAAAVLGFLADSDTFGACHSSICAAESFASFSAGGAGIAALRASGSSQAGIFTSSSSKLDFAGAGVIFGVAGTGELDSNLIGSGSVSILSTLAAAGSSLAISKSFAAASPSSCLEEGVTAAAGVPSLFF
jgi:hypothetical protein